MVLAMPGIHGQDLVEGKVALRAGMVGGALPLRLANVVQQYNPARVQGFQQRERYGDGRGGHVGQLGSGFFVVRPYDGAVFRQGQAEAAVAIQVRVGEVMDDLAARPATRPIGALQAFAAHRLGRGRELSR